ncbi:MAG: molybdopterin-dependent oxidoreductase [Proteobacteria bacterium]|nr:molybdopterin-dependent oxidoreductase [Pseudomonadota bacterium]
MRQQQRGRAGAAHGDVNQRLGRADPVEQSEVRRLATAAGHPGLGVGDLANLTVDVCVDAVAQLPVALVRPTARKGHVLAADGRAGAPGGREVAERADPLGHRGVAVGDPPQLPRDGRPYRGAVGDRSHGEGDVAPVDGRPAAARQGEPEVVVPVGHAHQHVGDDDDLPIVGCAVIARDGDVGAEHTHELHLVPVFTTGEVLAKKYFSVANSGTGETTLYVTSQNPHLVRLLMGGVLQIPEHKLRIVAPDVGGGFGSKIPHYPEEAVVTWAAKKVGRPVKWTAARMESFLADTHGRDHVTHAELALDENGRFLALRVKTTANLGAYLSTFAPMVPTYLYAPLLAGQYTTSAIHCSVTGVFTNTAPLDAERGAGRPEATFVVERLVEKAARELAIDPAELRRRNFISTDSFPYETPVVMTYDSGNYAPILDKALKMAAYDGFASRRKDSEGRGKLRGIGFSNYIEACGIAPSNVAGAIGARAGLYEAAEVRFHPTGSVTVFTGSQAQGQGHETTFSQIVSDKLGIPIENVEIVHGDTDRVPFGMGTYGSRSLAVGGSAIVKAIDKIIAKGKKIAAHVLESSEGDVEFEAGTFKVVGTDKSVSIADVAFAAYVPHNYPLEELEPGLDENAFYDPGNFTFPAGCHICEVEIDPETGVVDIVNWVAVDDFGKVINPMIVEGQVHGGVTQGIGQALLEDCVHDQDTGQLLTGSYMDYTMPRADNVPSFKVGFIETPCPHNPLGVKGCGEAGAIAAPAALINAVTGAIGASHLDMPATPEKVWRAIREAGKAPAE